MIYVFKKGFESVRERITTGRTSKYVMSCFNCNHYFKAPGDVEELCQNSQVLKYDIIVDGGRVYCSFWELFKTEEKTAAYLFKRRKNS